MPARRTELMKWFDSVTIQVEALSGSSDGVTSFVDCDISAARKELHRLQFMVENGLGPSDLEDGGYAST